MQAYIGNGKYIFVSYAHKDKDIAYPFIEALQKRFNVWYDDGIRLGSDYRRDIMNRLKSSSLFLFLVSNNSLNSDFCNKEIHFAETKGINFINIIIENIELPDWFEFDYGMLQNFMLYKYDDFDNAVSDLERNAQSWFNNVLKDGLSPVKEATFEKTLVETPKVIKKETPNITNSDEWKGAHGVNPIVNDKTIIYGLYPQSLVTDSALVDNLNKLTKAEKNGWYLFENEYYEMVIASPIGTNDSFINGNIIKKDEIYWFKCEPIVWNILSIVRDGYLLLSKELLDVHIFDESKNNYKNSEMRKWLNKDFYNTAFGLNNTFIKRSEVNNTESSTNLAMSNRKNEYACEYTKDYVSLASYQDYRNKMFGFFGMHNLEAKANDYIRAKGGYYSKIQKLLGNGIYYTRSPNPNYEHQVDVVEETGIVGGHKVNDSSVSIRPMIFVSMDIKKSKNKNQ